ncbi:hypothetical protein QWY82_15365 [Simiduia curdlanivorans]|uniref:MSHA biogenesis protein MshP n=1 Tax=Simiduia curdlanivorans TaxID=1492769 RepID=A0ABV8V233_9GAMM|nr:hypothetical protein [Simiduia curdlanivorans]MDN3640173.1 hypothetical protein [Simiduia curdlanivorans]
MPLAIFIIVSMAGFALGMARTTSQTNSSATQTMISIQAFYAADTGAQWGMNRLFYNTSGAISRASVDANCTALAGQGVSFDVVGLKNCSTQLQCVIDVDSSNTISYYRITSAAACGNAPIFAQRTVELSAFMK